jgi:hypothetical protein
MGTIKYYLRPNLMTTDPNDQSAHVQPKDILDKSAIAQLMVKRSSSFTVPVITGVLDLFFDVASDEVADGNHVNTPLVNLRPSIMGVFSSASDSFDPSRHIVKGTCSAGTLLNQKTGVSQTEKTKAPQAEPYLLEYNDTNSMTVNSLLTKGGIGVIIGEDLKFDRNNKEEGVFLVAANKEATRAETYAVLTEGKLIFHIPVSLAAGNYTLEVRRAYGVDSKIRIGQLRDTLTVN